MIRECLCFVRVLRMRAWVLEDGGAGTSELMACKVSIAWEIKGNLNLPVLQSTTVLRSLI